MAVGYRQCQRIWRRYQADGDAGLVHRLRGRPSARRKASALRTQVLAQCAAERDADFGPTLMAKHLAKEKLVVDHETLRRWLLANGQRTVRRRKPVHRQWRERKPRFGAMLQLDGSHHDWFEGRGPRCAWMVLVDDATHRMRARFFEQETTRASDDVVEGWIRRHGLPGSLSVDRDSIDRCEGTPSIAEQLAGQQPQTPFGRAMQQLGIELILAHSPQAKGRVERMNGVLPDRLVKELRLAGINDLAAANRFLERKYLRACQRQFARVAASPVDVHRPVPRNLDEGLSWEEQRVVQNDWTVACDGQRYQLDKSAATRSLVRRPVIVCTLRDGQVPLVDRGRTLAWRRLPVDAVRPKLAVVKASKAKTDRAVKLLVGKHPWRRLGIAAGQHFHRSGARASGPPPSPRPCTPATTKPQKPETGKKNILS